MITAVVVKEQGGPSRQSPVQMQAAQEFARIKPSDEEIAALVAAGRQLIVAGDISNARLLLQQAAEAGSAPAALALGGTYDPTIPQAQPASPTSTRAGPVPDPVSDVAMARAWYEKARDLGSTEARVRLDRLTNHSPGGR